MDINFYNLVELYKKQKENYLNHLYQYINDLKSENITKEILIISGKIKALEEFISQVEIFINKSKQN